VFAVWNATDNVTVETAGADGLATSLTVKKGAVTIATSTIAATTTLQQLTNDLGQTDGLYPTVGDRRPSSALASRLDFGTEADNYQKGVLLGSIEPFVLRDDVAQMVDWLNTNASDWLTATRAANATGTDHAEVGGSAPSNLGGGYTAFYGGSSGESSASNFQAGFDLMLQERINTVVPLISSDITITGGSIDWDVIAAQLSAHVKSADEQKTERNAYIGVSAPLYVASETVADESLISRARVLNNRNVSIVGQKPTMYRVSTQTVEAMPEWALAVVAAGMQGGAAIGEPITFKYANVSSFTQNADWSADDFTDSNAALMGSILFLERDDAGLIRWVRGLTTHLQDDNLALTDISVNEVRNYVSYDLRTDLEKRFIGRRTGKSTGATVSIPASANAIKGRADARLELYRAEAVIVDSEDAITGATLKAYQNLRVSISGDIATLRVQFFPVTGLNYLLIEQFLQLPVASA
jgi:hypothetical protein